VIIAVGGWRGAGATTTALLAANCLAVGDSGAWLIEADPAGGVLSGRIHLPPQAIGGLERVSFPTQRISATDAFDSVAHHVGGLKVVTAPADPFRAHACHQPRLPWTSGLRDLSGPVVIDVGRLRAGSPIWGVLTQADVVLLVTSPEVGAAVSAAEWLSAGGRVSPTDPGLPEGVARLVVVDAPCGVAFSRSVLQNDLADRWAGWLPWEPATVDLVHRGAGAGDRRLRRSQLNSAVDQMVGDLVGEGARR